MEQNNTVAGSQFDWETIFISIAINFISILLALLVAKKMI